MSTPASKIKHGAANPVGPYKGRGAAQVTGVFFLLILALAVAGGIGWFHLIGVGFGVRWVVGAACGFIVGSHAQRMPRVRRFAFVGLIVGAPVYWLDPNLSPTWPYTIATIMFTLCVLYAAAATRLLTQRADSAGDESTRPTPTVVS